MIESSCGLLCSECSYKRMSLGENRRQREAYSNESTFRMLKIKKNMGLL
jgi:hypothetical protein